MPSSTVLLYCAVLFLNEVSLSSCPCPVRASSMPSYVHSGHSLHNSFCQEGGGTNGSAQAMRLTATAYSTSKHQVPWRQSVAVSSCNLEGQTIHLLEMTDI